MTNNNNEENIHWEESTKHRDKFQKSNKSGAIKALIKTINLGIKGFNNTIGKIPGVNKVDEIDPEKTVAELAEAGGSSFTVGVIDDTLKFIRRQVIPKIQAGGFWTGAVSAGISWSIGSMEVAVDHLKDLMTSTAISGLAAEVGDLKDGQAKLNSKVDAQGKLMNKRMGDLKSELQGDLKKQGEKFDKEIKELDKKLEKATGENRKAIEKEKKERQAQYQQVQSQIKEVTQNLDRVEKQLTDALNDFKSEVNERFAEQEQKILENKRKIEEERIKREEEIREVKDNIKLSNTNIENLRKEKEQLEDEFINYKSQINQQTAETQQSFEDAQAEYDRRTRIIEAKIEDNQETIEEFNEQLNNVQHEQARQKLEQEEILENLQETNDLLFTQQHKLNLVAQQMEEIHEEVHERMDKLSQKLDERTNETLNIAKDTNKKVDQLTEEVQNLRQSTEQLQEQIKKNKEETEKAKKEAQLANERLDNYIKSQQLLDHSAEQSKLNKIQKSLQLKAEETKLLATLNLLQETKQLVRVELSEIEWKVGVKEGTEKDMPRPEGFPLKPGCSWTKKYTPEQLREWGWDTRLLGEHESAPLTDLDKRKEKQAPKNEKQSEAAGEETQQANTALEKIEELKAETLARLQEIQAEIRTGLEEVKNNENSSSTPPPPKPSAKLNQPITQAQAKVQQAKKKLTNQKTTETEAKKQARNQPTKENKQQAQEEAKATQQAQQELDQAQNELNSLQNQQEFQEQLEKFEEKTAQKEQDQIEKQWSQVQALSKQALQEEEKKDEEEKEQKEEDLNKKLEELVQQLKEMEQSAAASQKTMTKFMLFLIIFLLEYIVYKRNGLPGLVVLNVLLAIAYYYRDTLKEYAELWNKYLLIIGYVMGNVLAYSMFNTPEQEKYRWPAVIGFNLIIVGIYAYTLYQQKQEKAKIESFYQQETKKICEENNISAEEWKTIQQSSQPQGMGGIVDEYSIFANGTELRTEQLENLKTVIQTKEEAQQKELEIQQQAETLQKAAEIEKNLQQAQEGLGSPRMTWNRIKEVYPEFANKSVLLKELEKANRLLKKEEKETDQSFLNKLVKIPAPSEEECQLLSQLYLTAEQYIAISAQAQYLTRGERELLPETYPNLNTQQKLQLINSGLNNLGINIYEKKEKFVQLNHALYQEKQNFGLSTKEKENILRLLITTLDLTNEQRENLESMGVSFFDSSNWHISEEQKDHLLDFGLNKLKLTPEQQEQLTIIHPDQFKTFTLTGPQKNILNSLSPLIREDKYSEDSLQLFKSLNLKPQQQNFFVREEIIPDLNTQFGTVKSSYLPLKIKFLDGEQKTLRKIKEEQDQQISQEKIKENKLSILRSLMIFAEKVIEDEEYYLKDFNFSLADWVKIEVITGWQKDILFTCRFKTIPKYNFFELLIFAVEKFAEQNWSEFLQGNEDLAEEFAEYLKSLKNQPITINKTIWEKYASSQPSRQREIIQELNLKEIIEEQINKALGNWQPPTQETFYDSEEELEKTEENKESPETKSSTSRYDDLFSNLSQEDAARQKNKLERKEAQRKFEEAERERREKKLSEKDKKLQEQEEKRQKEQELAELEEQKRREAEAARAESLQKEQEALFQKKMTNIEATKKRAEEALANQIKKNELEEKKKRDEIEKMEKENEAEQERLKKQAELIEEEKQKKLAQIALEDEEERQRIEKRANEEKARIEAEMLEKKRKNDEELKKKENQLKREKDEANEALRVLEREAELQRTLAEEAKQAARHRENILKSQKNNRDKLEAHREYLWNQVLDYYWASSEAQAGTSSPNMTSGGKLRDWLRNYPNMEFNLYRGDGRQYESANWGGYRVAMKAFYGVVGADIFVNQYRFQELLRQRVNDLSIGMD